MKSRFPVPKPEDILIGADGSGNTFFARGGDDLLIGGNTFNYYQTGAGRHTVVRATTTST